MWTAEQPMNVPNQHWEYQVHEMQHQLQQAL